MWIAPSGWAIAIALALSSIIATQPADRVATTCVTDTAYCNPPPTEPRAVWAHCEQWHDLAAQVGWPEEQGYVLQHVLYRESRCNPGAYNPTPCAHHDHAIGLMQLCGWGGSELYDPGTNLARGLWLFERFGGWCPWAIPGDPVTGRHC